MLEFILGLIYRIGTLMELVRVLALSFADDGKRSMGEGALAGMPLQLAGTRQILEYMDWGSDGAMGNFITTGAIGTKEVDEVDDIFILVAPQNAMGNCIDLPASSGIMQTMGGEKRLEYAASFEMCYQFSLLYYAGTQYPFMGALRPTGDEINHAFEGRTRDQVKKASGFWYDFIMSVVFKVAFSENLFHASFFIFSFSGKNVVKVTSDNWCIMRINFRFCCGTIIPWLLPQVFTPDSQVIKQMDTVLLPYFIALSVTASTHSLEGSLLAGRDPRFISISMSTIFLLGGLLLMFEGNCFLWGVLHCPNDIKNAADAPLLLQVKCEPCDDVPPGFKKICKPGG
ncbi:adenylate kinase [Artemisia annua]|uniref:Adenylate kinase n=1 Tax=Artemisia annua TaxID=35608 RepID=A0A2U1N1D7_ARTAN|nr:adenylate kinase [Artemisia annua]